MKDLQRGGDDHAVARQKRQDRRSWAWARRVGRGEAAGGGSGAASATRRPAPARATRDDRPQRERRATTGPSASDARRPAQRQPDATTGPAPARRDDRTSASQTRRSPNGRDAADCRWRRTDASAMHPPRALPMPEAHDGRRAPHSRPPCRGFECFAVLRRQRLERVDAPMLLDGGAPGATPTPTRSPWVLDVEHRELVSSSPPTRLPAQHTSTVGFNHPEAWLTVERR
jgi:hypothetical protein